MGNVYNDDDDDDDYCGDYWMTVCPQNMTFGSPDKVFVVPTKGEGKHPSMPFVFQDIGCGEKRVKEYIDKWLRWMENLHGAPRGWMFAGHAHVNCDKIDEYSRVYPVFEIGKKEMYFVIM